MEARSKELFCHRSIEWRRRRQENKKGPCSFFSPRPLFYPSKGGWEGGGGHTTRDPARLQGIEIVEIYQADHKKLSCSAHN